MKRVNSSIAANRVSVNSPCAGDGVEVTETALPADIWVYARVVYLCDRHGSVRHCGGDHVEHGSHCALATGHAGNSHLDCWHVESGTAD